jgi:hypothetical protein
MTTTEANAVRIEPSGRASRARAAHQPFLTLQKSGFSAFGTFASLLL